ncbi:NRDE-2, necessary for RNA interference-domain-containing protein [Cercophora samala]|uniref:NRDE-2, necessary for RNA interference-domain-containing protein n=1 Tax=Cercophora samala TaxID=330535 RepID=A0AA40D9S9_9PEZI|nr:NRDE-2, necessary for RNA interference-domain-containing protein [Cercophora samala]
MMSSKEEKRQRAVPKFGSFQPKPTPAPEPGPASGEARKPAKDRHGDPGGESKRHHDREKDRDRRRSRSRDRDRDRERDRHRDRDRDRDRERRKDREQHHSSREDSVQVQPKTSTKPTLAALTINDNFFIDKKGDPLILRYGGNDRSKIPAYYRSGHGKILGSKGHLILHRDGPRDLFSLSFSREGLGSAFRDKALLSQIRRTKSRRIKSSTKPPPPPTEEFISLVPSKKRKRGQESPSSDSDSDHQPDYRSIYGKAKPPPSDTESSDSDISDSETPEEKKELSSAKKESITLTRHLRSSPTDVPSWLRLISLQDALFAEDTGHSRPRTENESKALAELKLSLYQEALSHLPSSSHSDEKDGLLLGMMTTGLQVWDDKTAARKWESLPQKYDITLDSSFGLWRARVDWEMGRVGWCTVDRIRDMFTAKLHALSRVLSGVEADKGVEICQQILYVFLRLTKLLLEAGYTERAVASWQALLDMTFSRPATAASAEGFEEFWESEVARFGEEGAKGWGWFVGSGGDELPPDPKFDDKKDEVDVRGYKDPYQLWAAMERRRAAKTRMPARTLDEGTEEDPFRVVMWGDIKDFVVWFPAEVLDTAKKLVVEGFAVFVGIPSICEEDFVKNWRRDPFLAPKGQAFRPWETSKRENTESVEVDLSKPPPEFGQQGGDMAISPELLFTKEGWFKCLDSWDKTHPPEEAQLDLPWVLSTLKQLATDHHREELAEIYLAMVWLNTDPKSTKKTAKTLLKQYTTNIRLYNAYALIEDSNNNPDLAFKILGSAVNLPQSQLLYNTQTWLHLLSPRNDLALIALCRSVDPSLSQPPSPAVLLKARSQFSTTIDFSLSSSTLSTATTYAESLLLLEYLSPLPPPSQSAEPTSPTQGNITPALLTIKSTTQKFHSRSFLPSPSPHLERLLQTASRLLYHHAQTGPYRPAFFLSTILSYLELFPSNTIFLNLLSWIQPPLLVRDPVREFLRETALQPGHDCVSTRRFAIMHEVNNGSVYSTRNAFEAAVGQRGAGKGNGEVWRGGL